MGRGHHYMLRLIFNLLIVLLLVTTVAVGGVVAYLLPQLPDIESLRDARMQVPLRVYSQDGLLIAEFGEKRRTPVSLADTPDLLVKAFLATEDQRFFDHPGVDWQAMVRAALALARTREISQGGSTITMQVARNFFLTPERTFNRKLIEVLLALKMERELSKGEILELYLNKIYLGQRAYGVAAAAQVYFGKSVDQLDLAEMALIAGLPKAPSAKNPISNPRAARERRDYVLGRMLEQGYIDEEAHALAVASTVPRRRQAGSEIQLQAPYVAEMVRAHMVEQYGEQAYTSGFKVVTTLQARLQTAAASALRGGLLDYDQRHGYRGPEARVALSGGAGAAQWQAALEGMQPVGGLLPVVVTALGERSARVYNPQLGEQELDWEALSWARPYLSADARGPRPDTAADILAVGDVIRLQALVPEDDGGTGRWRLAQLPSVQGALVALDPNSGAIRALAGGFDFDLSKFNRATQARRQPGSSFKPFIYSAALEAGYTPASFINDAPIVFETPGLDRAWRPENYTGRYYGPTRLREAITHSRNLVSIRLLRAIGIGFALDHLERFGFDRERLPANLSLALGSGEVSPLELGAAYSVLANGGHRVEPWFIASIESADAGVLWKAEPQQVCPACGQNDDTPAQALPAGALPASTAPRVIHADNAWMMNSMMQDVVANGTARRARSLGRGDLAGKTGTTNDQRDAWFAGFNNRLVAVAWVGFDQLSTLGNKETGSRAALPVWIDFMSVALEGMPDARLPQPAGLVTVRIDPETGLLAESGAPDAILESFRPESVPRRSSSTAPPASGSGNAEQLF